MIQVWPLLERWYFAKRMCIIYLTVESNAAPFSFLLVIANALCLSWNITDFMVFQKVTPIILRFL